MRASLGSSMCSHAPGDVRATDMAKVRFPLESCGRLSPARHICADARVSQRRIASVPSAALSHRAATALVAGGGDRVDGARAEARQATRAADPSGAAFAPDYAALVNALPDPMLVVSGSDPEDFIGRRYIFANPSAREFLRLDHAQ